MKTLGDFETFVKGCSDVELCILQKDLIKFPEDKDHLDFVINELKERNPLKNGFECIADADTSTSKD